MFLNVRQPVAGRRPYVCPHHLTFCAWSPSSGNSGCSASSTALGRALCTPPCRATSASNASSSLQTGTCGGARHSNPPPAPSTHRAAAHTSRRAKDSQPFPCARLDCTQRVIVRQPRPGHGCVPPVLPTGRGRPFATTGTGCPVLWSLLFAPSAPLAHESQRPPHNSLVGTPAERAQRRCAAVQEE